MSNTFEQRQAQMQAAKEARRTPSPNVSPTGNMDPMAPYTPPPPPHDPSLMDPVGVSRAMAATGVADTLAYATGLESEQQEMLKGAPLSPQEQGGLDPSFAQTAWQLAGDTVGLVWDWGSDVLVEAGQEGISLLPTTVTEAGTAKLRDIAQSDVGQAGLKAAKQGGEAWDAFANQYPQEARTLAKGFDMVPGSRAFKRIKMPTALTPLRIDKVGNRNILRSPTGRDKDVYNMVVPEQTKKQKTMQVAEGRVSDPEGLGRSQNVIPSDTEWKVIDELKSTDVSANKTMQQNSNVVLSKLDELNEQTRRRAAGTKGGVDHEVLMQSIRDKLGKEVTDNPAIFGKDGKKASKSIDDIFEQLEVILDTNGTSWEGILRSRQELDNLLLKKMQVGTYGTGRKASAVQEAHKAARGVINDLVKANVPGTDKLLGRQHRLFTGFDSLSVKAADESSSALGRLLREINVHNPTTPLAQLSTLLSPVVWAGAVAVSPFVLANKARRGVMQLAPVAEKVGTMRNGIRDVITESQKMLKMVKDPDLRKQMQVDIKVMATLLHTLPAEGNMREEEAEPMPPLAAAGY
jgi:hypothetical protein